MPVPGYPGLRFGLPAGSLLRRLWAERRPDAVYVATEGPLGYSAVSSAKALGIPAFSGFHTNFHAYSQHYHLGWLRFLIMSYLRAFHNRTTATIAASPELRDRLQKIGVKNVSVLGRGVDHQLFHPRWRSAELRCRWGAAADDILVALYVGRLAPEKNLELAITSYQAMRKANDAVKFVLVGDGPERVPLQRKHTDLIFCGVKTGEALAAHYASADIFLFPSATETFGNVVLEALASGLAVVAYDYAAARLHIRHGDTGVLAPLGDVHSFTSAAVQLVCDPVSLCRMRHQAAIYASSLDWQRVFDRFAGLLLGGAGQEEAAMGRVSAASF
jgi:glycosyltransferase involved in cell wall biosynthesis